MSNKKLLEIQNKNHDLNQITKVNEEANNIKLSQILDENNNLKKSIDSLNIENQNYKIENSKLIEQNNFLNLKIQILLSNNQQDISNNKSFGYLKSKHNYNESNNLFNNKVEWENILNCFNEDKTVDNKENYLDNSNNFDNISLINKKINSLNKKNKEIFKIICKNSKSFQKI